MRILSFSTHKGGTGKTTSSINLAVKLGRDGYRTLLIDVDPQGHATLGVGLDLAYDEPNIADVLTDRGIPLGKVVRPTSIPNLTIAPSNIRLASVAESLYAKMRREERLQKNLTAIQEPYEWVVIDCPPALGVLTEAAIAAADRIIIPCQMEARAADGLVDLLEVIGLIKGEAFDAWRILLTKIDSRKTTTNQAVMAALAPWAPKICKTTIPQSEPLNQAQIERTDIFSFEPKSTGALAYESFAKEMLRYGR